MIVKRGVPILRQEVRAEISAKSTSSYSFSSINRKNKSKQSICWLVCKGSVLVLLWEGGEGWYLGGFWVVQVPHLAHAPAMCSNNS